MKSTQAALVILIILVIDQWSKFYIKTHFALHDSVVVFSWFKIYFIENEGMAWGAKIPGHYGKLILTVFRLLAISRDRLLALRGHSQTGFVGSDFIDSANFCWRHG